VDEALPETPAPEVEASEPPQAVEAGGPAPGGFPAPVADIPETTEAPEELQTAVALLVAENEKAHPYCDGPYEAVPVDSLQEDLEFSAMSAGSVGYEPLFGPRPEPAQAPADAGSEAKKPVKEENLVEVEPHDASSGIDEVEPASETTVPVPSGEGGSPPDAAPAADEASDELQPWTGSASKYKSDTGKKKREEREEDAEDDELKPWTGSARSYKSKDKPGEKREPATKDEDIPEIDPAEAADLGMDQALVADAGENEDAEGFREGLEDLPEIKPMAEPKLEEVPAPAQPDGDARPKKKLKKLKKKKKKLKRPDGKSEAPGEEPAEAPKKKKKKIGAPTAGDGSDYSVFLSKIVSSDRRRKAVELLTDIKGISGSEAEKLTNKMIIPVVKGVSKDEAEEILDRFKKSKISGRITRKK